MTKIIKPKYTIKHIPDADDGDYVVVALYKKKQIAVAVFNEYGSELQSDHTEVDKIHRRAGVASAMYDFAEKNSGFKVAPASENQTKDAIKFWQSRNKRKNS